ncbi:hypothetical protein M5L40_003608 [Clostridium botulinum]|nr:hypothetical protein [Clostridium botulinum]
MLSIYISYKCCSCKHEFVLLNEDVKDMIGYLVCPYCSSKRVRRERVADNLKECMNERSYRRIKGALRQR